MRFPVRTFAVVAFIGVAVGLALLGRDFLRRDESPPLPVRNSSARALYDAHCAVCHGSTGKGDGPGATVLRQVMPDFTNPAAMGAVTDRFLFEIIKKGSSQFGRSNAMPSWGMRLSDEQIRALVVYIRSLAPGTSAGPRERKETP
jgi:mono/diheme cytochrome c family protein